MVSGFFGAGLAQGINNASNSLSQSMNQQALIQLEGARIMQDKQNKQQAQYMKLRSDAVTHLDDTMTQLRIAHPDWTDQQLIANPAVVSLRDSIGSLDKNLKLPNTIDSIVASIAAKPSAATTARTMAEATGTYGKTQAQTEEAKARTGYLNRGGAALPDNPDLDTGAALGSGNRVAQGFAAVGNQPSPEDSIKQKYGARTIFKAEQYLAGNTSVLTGLGYGKTGAAARKQVQDAAADLAIARGMKPEEVNAEIAGFMGQKRAASAAGLRVGNVTVAMDAAQAASTRVLATSDKVNRTQYPSLNSVLLAAQRGTGDENVVQYGIAVNTLVNNYARAVGGGNQQLTDAARKEAYDNLNTAWSKGQIKAAVDQINKEIASELSGAQKAMKDVTKSGGDGFQPTGIPGVTIREKQ